MYSYSHVIPSFSRVTLLVKIDTQAEKKLAYQAGDHVSIFPANDVKLVETLLSKLHKAPQADKPINIQTCTVESGNCYKRLSLRCLQSTCSPGFVIVCARVFIKILVASHSNE